MKINTFNDFVSKIRTHELVTATYTENIAKQLEKTMEYSNYIAEQLNNLLEDDTESKKIAINPDTFTPLDSNDISLEQIKEYMAGYTPTVVDTAQKEEKRNLVKFSIEKITDGDI